MSIEVKGEVGSEHCKEQATTSGSISIFRSESLTHRRSTSINISGSGNSVQNNHHRDAGSTIRNDPACLCTKCHARTTSHKLCSECELLLNQEAKKRWKTLASLTKTAGWQLYVKDAKSALLDDDTTSTLLNRSVTGNERNSPQWDHAIDITPDVNSKTSPNSEVNPDSRGNERSIIARATRLVFMCHCIMKKTTIKLVKSWVFIKGAFRLLNVAIEVCQAIATQENARKKISDSMYIKLAFATSFACLVIALVEIIGEGKRSRAKCLRNGYCCWLYYPERRLFGKFSLYFGVASSMIQFLINFITFIMKERFIIRFSTIAAFFQTFGCWSGRSRGGIGDKV